MAMHDLRLIAFDVKRGLSRINSYVCKWRELITNISRPLSRSFPEELVIATSRGESLVTV